MESVSIYVAKNGYNETGTGIADRPFITIKKAVKYAQITFLAGKPLIYILETAHTLKKSYTFAVLLKSYWLLHNTEVPDKPLFHFLETALNLVHATGAVISNRHILIRYRHQVGHIFHKLAAEIIVVIVVANQRKINACETTPLGVAGSSKPPSYSGSLFLKPNNLKVVVRHFL